MNNDRSIPFGIASDLCGREANAAAPTRSRSCRRAAFLTGAACSAFGLALFLLLATPVPAQDFMLDTATLAGGGEESSGGDFSLQATIGEPDVSDMAGGDFALSGGFWSLIAALETPNSPPLTLTVNGAQVTLSWAASSGAGFLVQEATALAVPPATTTWTTLSITPQNVGGMEVVQLPLTAGNRFYRLAQ